MRLRVKIALPPTCEMKVAGRQASAACVKVDIFLHFVCCDARRHGGECSDTTAQTFIPFGPAPDTLRSVREGQFLGRD